MSDTDPRPVPPSTEPLLKALTEHADDIAREFAAHLDASGEADMDQIRAIIAEARARLAAGGATGTLPIFMQASGPTGGLRGVSLSKPDNEPEEPDDQTGG
jgi:hypothetical protein